MRQVSTTPSAEHGPPRGAPALVVATLRDMADPPSMQRLPSPEPGDELRWVTAHLGHLCVDEPRRSERFVGTQAAADAALASFDVTNYARRRNQVQPVSSRGASGLSPWIRHGLLTLPDVWAAVEGPARDRKKFRDELRWQEYARHVYARLGHAMAEPLRYRVPTNDGSAEDAWDRSMRCVEYSLDDLESDGWMVNQTRMWLASQWSVRHGLGWNDGEQHFFAHLLDGSRAANQLGWQWTIGAGTGKPYGFSQWQVRKRAPSLCGECAHQPSCPIADWPGDRSLDAVDPNPLIRHDPDVNATAGPGTPSIGAPPEIVWLTAESLGGDDPAMRSNPDLPVWFVFDEPLLASLRLSSKRLVFLTERLGELAQQRPVELVLGDPIEVLAGHRLATTFAPVPGWRRRSASLDVSALYPWPWLERPRSGSVASFTAWSKGR